MAWKVETVAREHRRISAGRFSRKYVCVASQERVVLDALAWFVTLTAGHRYFRVPKNLTFETRLSGKPLL